MKGDFAPKRGPRVVVIGGGWGGATAAKYVRLLDPGVEVVLIEPNRRFVSCPFSNLALAGVRAIDSLTMGYDGLRKHGVRIIHETATAIELSPEMEPYAKQVLSIGVDDVAAYFASRKRAPTPVTSPADAVTGGGNAAAQCTCVSRCSCSSRTGAISGTPRSRP